MSDDDLNVLDMLREDYPGLVSDIEGMIERCSKMPDWHDRPTCPGLWLGDYDDEYATQTVTENILQFAGRGWMARRYYGPIPEGEEP